MSPDDPFNDWVQALERRHLSELTFPELRRAVQALSRRYVEQRGSRPLRVFDGAGKRAAFALFYGPLHFRSVSGIVDKIGAAEPPPRRILDLGCGTGAAGAAWAVAAGGRTELQGIDLNRWAVGEANRTRQFWKLTGSARSGDLTRLSLPGRADAVLAAYTVNELPPEARDALLRRLMAAAEGGVRLLIVEPISRAVTPWWPEWSAAFIAAGGRDDDWRFAAELPERLRLLDRAAGLDHGELTARSLYLRRPVTVP